MGKVLFIAASDIHLHVFHRPYLDWLAAHGHIVDLAFDKRADYEFLSARRTFQVDFPRALYPGAMLRSYRRLKHILESDQYDLVHCHTPIPSALARLAARKSRKRGCKVLYTAHGFHFHHDATVWTWLVFYPVEYLLSAFTDGIVTVNEEDFGYVNGRMLHRTSFLIPGMGVSAARFAPADPERRAQYRVQLGYSASAFMLMYVAEFAPGKNHQFLVDAAQVLSESIPDLKIVFVGTGGLRKAIEREIERRQLHSIVECVGFREDVPVFAACSDVGISASKREGLVLGLIEQMMCGVPIVAPRARGHNELVDHGETGFLFQQGNQRQFIAQIEQLYRDPKLRAEMGRQGHRKAHAFRIEESLRIMSEIYEHYLERPVRQPSAEGRA